MRYGAERQDRMRREVDVRELQRLYGAEDMVRADCGGCAGCHSCCQGMGDSIGLDPWDVWNLCRGTGRSLEELINGGYAELGLDDGLVLPHLRMRRRQDGQEACGFLSEEGRCLVHPFRPGICRLFPLGRYYENGDFRYYLQMNQCPKPVKAKVRVRKWLEIEELERYEQFVRDWHSLLTRCRQGAGRCGEEARKKASLLLLRIFYLAPYETEADFYGQFEARKESAGSVLAGLFVE